MPRHVLTADDRYKAGMTTYERYGAPKSPGRPRLPRLSPRKEAGQHSGAVVDLTERRKRRGDTQQ